MQQLPSGAEPTLSNYQLRLPTYEGPLDVLLRLIERSQLDIEDVSLVAVTDQFFAFIETLESAPPFVIAEFAAVGARLTVLKSRSLLPRPIVETEEPEQSDLTHQLREYKRVKELAGHLAALHAAGGVAHAPAINGAITMPVAGKPTRIVQYDASVLVRSLRRRLTVIPRAPQFIRQRRVVSLRDLVTRLTAFVQGSGSLRFSQVVIDYRTRTEVATAFLAMLILVRRQSIDVVQADLFGDIAISPGTTSGTLDPSFEHDEFLH